MNRNRPKGLSSMEQRIASRAKPRFQPTDEQIEVAGEAARDAYRSNAHMGEVARWECAAEAALRTLRTAAVAQCTCSDGQVCTVCCPTTQEGDRG